MDGNILFLLLFTFILAFLVSLLIALLYKLVHPCLAPYSYLSMSCAFSAVNDSPRCIPNLLCDVSISLLSSAELDYLFVPHDPFSFSRSWQSITSLCT